MILLCNLSLSLLLPVFHAASFNCKTLFYDFFQLLEAKRSFTDQSTSECRQGVEADSKDHTCLTGCLA